MDKSLRFLILILTAICSLNIVAETHDCSPRKWGIQAGIGATTITDNSPEGQPFYVSSDDEGNTFYLSADYFLNPRLALTGGLYFEQNGMLTNYASGIGLKKNNMMGLTGGAKYYFFPKKWIVQPHIGAALQTNFLNLGRSQGKGTYVISNAYPGAHLYLEHDVRCPALCIMPQAGVDIRLLSTVSLCIDYDYRINLGGHNRALLRFNDGPLIGKTAERKTEPFRTAVSIGLKIDFPTRRISNRTYTNLLWLIESWISSKTERY